MSSQTRTMGSADILTEVAAPICPTTPLEQTKIIYIPRIAVLQDKIRSGAPITQAILKEIYDMAFALLKHRHTYTDLVFDKFGNIATEAITTSSVYTTDYPAQLNNLVELGSPLMQGVVFEKWYLCPDAYNIRLLDSAPMIYSRQYKLPSSGGITYNAITGENMPQNIQNTSIGAVFDFYLDTSTVINVQQTLSIKSSGDTLVYIDNTEHLVNGTGQANTTQNIIFTPKNVRTHIAIHWAGGDRNVYVKTYQVWVPEVRWPWGWGHRNAIRVAAHWETVNESYIDINTPGTLIVKLNNKSIPVTQISALTPQASLNTTVTDARISSIYALWQIIMILCNHRHTYLDFNFDGGNQTSSVNALVTTLENFYVSKNIRMSYDVQSYRNNQITGYDGNGDPIYTSYFSGYSTTITNLEVFSQPVAL